MLGEAITNRKEIENLLVRARACTFLCKTDEVTGRALLVDIEDWHHLTLRLDDFRLKAGTPAELEFVVRASRYCFRASALEARYEGMRFSYPTKIYRINLRDFYRVWTPPESRISFTWQGRTIEAGLLNLSAGGAAFVTERFTEDVGSNLEEIEISLTIGGELHRVQVPSASVRRIAPREGSTVRYGIAFQEVSKELRERLIIIVRRRELELARRRAEQEG